MSGHGGRKPWWLVNLKPRYCATCGREVGRLARRRREARAGMLVWPSDEEIAKRSGRG